MLPGDPLAVGRPIVGIEFPELILVHLGDGLGGDIDVAKPLQPIGPEKLATVGRPDDPIIISIRMIGQLDGLAFSILRAHIKFVLPGRVGVVGNPFPVGRPDGVALVRVRGPGEIARRAVPGGHGEKIAPGHHHGAFAVGRETD